MNAKLTAIAASLAFTFAAGAYAQGAGETSGASGQPSQKQNVDDQHKAAMEKCDGMKDNAKEICEAEADAQKTIGEAQAKVSERDTPKNRLDLEKAKAEANYKVARARCGDEVGDAKKACEKEAKAAQDLAMARAERQALSPTSGGSPAGAQPPGQAASSGVSAAGAGAAGQPPAQPQPQPQAQPQPQPQPQPK